MREYTRTDFLAHNGKTGEAGQIGSRGSGFTLHPHEPISFYVAPLRETLFFRPSEPPVL